MTPRSLSETEHHDLGLRTTDDGPSASGRHDRVGIRAADGLTAIWLGAFAVTWWPTVVALRGARPLLLTR